MNSKVKKIIVFVLLFCMVFSYGCGKGKKGGMITFTQEENIVEGNIVVRVPEHCNEITVMVYADEAKKELYGIKNYGKKSFFDDELLVLWISEFVIESIGQEAYNSLLASKDATVYLQIIAKGDKNYESAVVDMEYTLK